MTGIERRLAATVAGLRCLTRPSVNVVPTKHRNPTPDERDDRVAIPLDAEVALRGLLAVDPESDPVDDEDAPAK